MGNPQYTAIGIPATSYPVPPPTTTAKRPKPSNNANPNPNPNATSTTAQKICNAFCYLLIAVAVACFVVDSIIQQVWPTASPELLLTALSLSGFNLSSSTVSGNWTASFTVVNPNKKTIISYTDLHATLSYRHLEIAIANLPPFTQETSSATNVSATFLATSLYLEGKAVNKIAEERSRGRVEFNIKFRATAHYEARGRSYTKEKWSYVGYCYNLPVEVSSDSAAGEFADGPLICGEEN